MQQSDYTARRLNEVDHKDRRFDKYLWSGWLERSNKVWKPDKPWPSYATYRKGRKPNRHQYDEDNCAAGKHDEADHTVRKYDEIEGNIGN